MNSDSSMTRYLQTTFPQLEGFFVFISTLGLEEFYLALFPLIYWCIHKTMGKIFAYVFLLANALNPLFKYAFRGPRPFWFDPSLGLWEETSYGVPSGHVQLATVTYLFLAIWIQTVVGLGHCVCYDFLDGHQPHLFRVSFSA